MSRESRARCKCDEQRGERDPTEGGMTKLGEAQREEKAGGGRERVVDQRVIQGLKCSSFSSFAAMDSASRRELNFPTRTRNTDGAPLAGGNT